jgi:hypothetical protein
VSDAPQVAQFLGVMPLSEPVLDIAFLWCIFVWCIGFFAIVLLDDMPSDEPFDMAPLDMAPPDIDPSDAVPPGIVLPGMVLPDMPPLVEEGGIWLPAMPPLDWARAGAEAITTAVAKPRRVGVLCMIISRDVTGRNAVRNSLRTAISECI